MIAKAHKSFCAKEGLHFKLLADNAHQVTRSYGSLTTYEGQEIANRNTFIINPDGVIAKQFIDVDPNHHSQEVLAAQSAKIDAVGGATVTSDGYRESEQSWTTLLLEYNRIPAESSRRDTMKT